MRSRLSPRLFGLLAVIDRFMPRVIAALTALVVAVGPWAFHVESARQGRPMPWDQSVYATLGLFAFAGSGLERWPALPLLRVIHFLAPALAASALIGAFIRVLEERGPIFLGSFQKHVVIGGLGNLGATLARHLMKHRHEVIAIERSGDAPAVDEMRAAGASLVMVGDMTSSEMLRKTRAPWAERVFFVSRSDVVNLDAAFQVRRLAKLEGVARPPVVFAHCFDAGLADALEAQLRDRGHGTARIVTFNSYRFAAKALLGELLRERLLGALRIAPGLWLQRTAWPEGDPACEAPPPSSWRARDRALAEDRRRLLAAFRLAPEAEASRGERFAIAGFGRFGRSVLRELIGATPDDARFLVLDRADAEARAAVEHVAGPDASRCEIAHVDAASRAGIERLVAFQPTAVIVCTDNDLCNLRLAVELRRWGLRTVTRMSGGETEELARGLEEEGILAVGLSRLFRAAIPILTHEQRLRGCLNLDVHHTPEVDHLFYVARVPEAERRLLGAGCVPLRELPRSPALDRAALDEDLVIVWHREAERLAV